jgi:pyrroloquinoline-quinone synthase
VNLLAADELEARLRDIGARRYHRLHPFHELLHGGRCSKGQVQAWALNRYIYRAAIPRKDASLNCDVHRRDLECPVYVDSSRPWRKDAAMV